jgi:protein-S-isoprenylcysteine O-methyltransferase Ste14
LKKFLPPTYFYICVVISVVLHFVLPITHIIEYPFNWLCFLFFLVGGILNIWTDQIFEKNKTTVKPDEKPTLLIQSGPFKISRNPMYLGMAIILVGVGFVLGSVSSFVGVIIFIITVDMRFINQEENILKEQFGDEFESYKKKVRKWI